jgi:L-ascorbate metabolism protein UlaG (beta-lactamase superfamily)
MKTGSELIQEIDQTLTATPTLWWLGHAGFVIRFAHITFYVDPCLSRDGALLSSSEVTHADMFLATHAHAGHMDSPSLVTMLQGSKRAKVILPKSAADAANAQGIPFPRMTTTDADLRVEFFKDNLYGRVYSVPSAHPELERTAIGGYPYLGYLIRFGRWTIYHAGDCVYYEGLADRLRPYTVSVALLPIGGKNFSINDAAQLTADIGAKWILPMHYEGQQMENDFLSHMLGHRPYQKFKLLQRGEKWTVPEE